MTTNPTRTSKIELSDEAIVEGLRNRDPQVTRDFFYTTCRIAYHIYDKQYDLKWKAGLDFYSIAHEYYLQLDKHNFRQLEDHKPTITLQTWMINGFRFILLDRLKAYQKESRMQSFEERMGKANLRFDVPDNNFSENFRNTVLEICHCLLGRDSRSALILQMILVDGFKGKEVARQLGITPSAVTQRYHKLLEDVVTPYFKRFYEAQDEKTSIESIYNGEPNEADFGLSEAVSGIDILGFTRSKRLSAIPDISCNYRLKMNINYQNRITPDYITSLNPGEIFVFGSNLAGMHGGGAARTARLHFGAVLGKGDGPQGQSYAIPTMQGGVETIRPYVNKFVGYARAHPELTFLVTPIGCGIAGFTPDDIAPLFQDAALVENIHLPLSFWKEIVG